MDYINKLSLLILNSCTNNVMSWRDLQYLMVTVKLTAHSGLRSWPRLFFLGERKGMHGILQLYFDVDCLDGNSYQI